MMYVRKRYALCLFSSPGKQPREAHNQAPALQKMEDFIEIEDFKFKFYEASHKTLKFLRG